MVWEGGGTRVRRNGGWCLAWNADDTGGVQVCCFSLVLNHHTKETIRDDAWLAMMRTVAGSFRETGD